MNGFIVGPTVERETRGVSIDQKTIKQNEQGVQDEVAEHYEALRYRLPYAKRYHTWWVSQMIRLARRENRQGAILDNGCGTGILFEQGLVSSATFGVDLSYEMLRKAQARNQRVVQGSSLALPFRDNTFDLILARSLLHHLSDPSAGIIEMHRVLRPGGQLIAADTNNSLLSCLPRKLAYRRENFSDHHQNFARSSYFGWLAKYFTIEHVQYFGYLAYPLGFPDIMGPFRAIPFPVQLVNLAIVIDRLISAIPGVRTQSWGLIVAVRKA